jgi:hypothetical protein
MIDSGQDEIIACRTELTADGLRKLVTPGGAVPDGGNCAHISMFLTRWQALEWPRRARMSGTGVEKGLSPASPPWLGFPAVGLGFNQPSAASLANHADFLPGCSGKFLKGQ